MQKKISLSLSILLILLAILITFMSTFVGISAWTKKEAIAEAEEDDEDTESFDVVKQLFETYYIGDLDEDTISDYMIAGYVAGTQDKYAHYYDAEGAAALKDDMGGTMQGIGVSVIYNSDYMGIEILNVYSDSPAMEAGVEAGDIIMYVGDDLVSVASLGYEMAVKALQGEAGTTAKFVVYRGEDYSEQITFEIQREYITEQTVTYRLYSLDETVGIVKITGFDTATVEQFSDALTALEEMGAQKLVFDVRNNPGGELKSIESILDTLLPEGPVIRTIDKTGEETVIYYSDEEEIDMPMAVVVNSNTASAAELFSSALQDYNKAKIVGTVTYGKGCMQTIFNLPNGGCVSLTTALYCPPFSDNYDGVGVIPDVEVELSEEAASKNLYKLTDEEDSQLAAAVATFGE